MTNSKIRLTENSNNDATHREILIKIADARTLDKTTLILSYDAARSLSDALTVFRNRGGHEPDMMEF